MEEPEGQDREAVGGPEKPVAIRDFTMDDYENVMRMWEDAGLPHKPGGRDSRDDVAAQLAFPGTFFLVAETDGETAGTLIATHDGRKGWINRLAVRPSLRQRGVAAALVAEGERRLAEGGIRIIAVLVEDWNHTSLEVFSRLGYLRHDDIVYFTKREDPDV